MLQRLSSTTVAAVLLLLNSTVCAQSAPEEAKKQVRAACGNTVNAAMKRLRPHLGDHAYLRDKPDLVVVMPVANFNAYAHYENQQILVPVMLCIETWYLLDGMMQMHLDPPLREKMKQYVKYLSRRKQDSFAKATGFDDVPIMPFHEFAGNAYPSVSDDKTKKMIAVREGIMVESMAFVLGHEIGHLALRHKRYDVVPPETARQQESDADDFSAKLLTKAGISVLAAIPLIQRFLEDEQVVKKVRSAAMTHPRAECRMERIVRSNGELEEMLRNPDRRREYELGSGLSAADLEKTLGALREDCAQHPLGGTPLARIISAGRERFASIRVGRSESIDGERNWDATVSIDGRKPCTVWEGKGEQRPRVSCSIERTKDEGLAMRSFEEALNLVKSTIPGDWKRAEREYANRVRSKSVEYSGPQVTVRISLNRYESTGNSDVSVIVTSMD